MPFSRRLLVAALVVGLACSEGSAPPVPSAMTLTSGNNQSGLPGVTLTLPLTVTVTGAGGTPFAGARVTWAVTTGSAALGSPLDTTDAAGVSTTTVTVGVVPGNLVVSATVTGVPAVTFQLTTLDPCLVRIDVPSDTTITTAVLTNFDCAVFIGSAGPFFTDFYRFTLPAQAGLVVSMNATYDTYVEQFFSPSGAFIAFSDDTDSSNTNSRLNIIAGAGTYLLAASTFAGSVTGAYSIALAPRTQTLTGCRNENFLPWLSRGVALAEQIGPTDCVSFRTGNGRAFGDRALIVLTPTRNLAASYSSAAFNPRLELYELTQTGLVFRVAGDGVSGTASLNFTPAAGGLFRLEMTSVDTVGTGAYTLNITGPAPNVAELIGLPYPVNADAARPRTKR